MTIREFPKISDKAGINADSVLPNAGGFTVYHLLIDSREERMI